MTPGELRTAHEAATKLLRKMEKYTEARRIAETAFSTLKFKNGVQGETTQAWKNACKAAGWDERCDFGDLSC